LVSFVAAILAILAAEPLLPEARPLFDLPEPTSRDHRPARPILRTGLELLGILGIGAAWYWRAPSYGDFDIRFTWKDWRDKLFSTRDIVLDDNQFNTNTVAHPLAGAVYYQLARGNGLSAPASLLTSVIGSTVWEYLVEFNEKPSTNDLIFTPLGGAVIGEATYRLGRLFASGSPNLGNCLGAIIFAPVAAMNDPDVCRSGARPPYDAYGLSRWLPHLLEMQAGLSYSRFDSGPVSGDAALGFSTDIVSHRWYGRSGQASTTVRPGDWTTLQLGTLIDGRGVQGLAFHADMTWWGRYRRRFDEGGPALGAPDGRGLMLAVRSSFDYDDRTIPDGLDRVANVGLAGPVVELRRRRGRLAVRATVAAEYGFALVTSLAYPAAATASAGETIKSELRKQGYYYAQSVTGRASLRAELAGWELLLQGRIAGFWSINGDDRFQEKITDNFSLSDQRTEMHAAVRAPLFRGPLVVSISADQLDRQSELPGFRVHSRERRGGASVGFRF